MTDSINRVPPELQHLALNETRRESNKELGQTEFLELMLTQLQNQDPTSPMESGQFLSQLAQFGTVNGITELQSSFNALTDQLQSNQALQASTLVGRTVLVEGNSAQLTQGEALKAAVNLDASVDNVQVAIFDASGQQVQQLNLGIQAPGTVNFAWDGKDADGNDLPSGQYRIEAIAQGAGDPYSLNTLINAKVESVTLPSGGSEALLNLGSAGLISINQVSEVM